jgi:hypothetical protein
MIRQVAGSVAVRVVDALSVSFDCNIVQVGIGVE